MRLRVVIQATSVFLSPALPPPTPHPSIQLPSPPPPCHPCKGEDGWSWEQTSPTERRPAMKGKGERGMRKQPIGLKQGPNHFSHLHQPHERFRLLNDPQPRLLCSSLVQVEGRRAFGRLIFLPTLRREVSALLSTPCNQRHLLQWCI